MGTFESFRKAYGALKDSTKVGLAKVNSEFKDLDIAIVKATNHDECPPKERHIRKILSATSSIRPRADVAYCIHALSKRLTKTRNWIVAIKTLIVFHRTLREGDPTFREELLHYIRRGQVFQISGFKDDSSPLAWDCSAWVRTYALFLEERLECFRTLKYDIETDRLTKPSPGGVSKVYSRTQLTNCEELLVQLPALQQFLYRLLSCQPEGAAYHNYLVQYALALVLKESFKIYCAINDRIINLVDMYFDMSKHDAIKALNIYKRAWQQAEYLADFYDFCKHLDLARNFQFPVLRQQHDRSSGDYYCWASNNLTEVPPPHSFLATMEEYIKEAPQFGSTSSRRIEYQEIESMKEPENIEEPSTPQEQVEDKEEEKQEEVVEKEDEPHEAKNENEVPPLIATNEPTDLLGLNEVNPQAAALEESNAMALAIFQPGNEPTSMNNGLSEIGKTSGWELALVTTPSNTSNNNNNTTQYNLGGGFDKLLLDSLYEDEAARRQLQLQNAGYNTATGGGYGYEHNQFDGHDPFFMSNNIAPPTNVQMAAMQQQQMMHQQQQQQHHQNAMMMVPYQNQPQYYQQQQQQQHHHQQQMPYMGGSSNPFGDPFSYPERNIPPHPHGNNSLL